MFGDRCPRCGKGSMVTDNSSGEMFCGNCGFVINERIEELGPEWRAFSKEEHEHRSNITALPIPDAKVVQTGRGSQTFRTTSAKWAHRTTEDRTVPKSGKRQIIPTWIEEFYYSLKDMLPRSSENA